MQKCFDFFWFEIEGAHYRSTAQAPPPETLLSHWVSSSSPSSSPLTLIQSTAWGPRQKNRQNGTTFYE